MNDIPEADVKRFKELQEETDRVLEMGDLSALAVASVRVLSDISRYSDRVTSCANWYQHTAYKLIDLQTKISLTMETRFKENEDV